MPEPTVDLVTALRNGANALDGSVPALVQYGPRAHQEHAAETRADADALRALALQLERAHVADCAPLLARLDTLDGDALRATVRDLAGKRVALVQEVLLLRTRCGTVQKEGER